MKGKLSEVISRFANQRILVVGDVMLDRYVYGDVKRISPEAPIQILSRNTESLMLGGAGNVVRNLQSLGAHVGFVSVVGPDEAGSEIRKLLAHDPIFKAQGAAYLFVEQNRITPEKTRYVSDGQQLLRVDHECAADIEKSKADVLRIVESVIEEYDILVLSDYNKGTLTNEIIQRLIIIARRAGRMVIADPKKPIKNYNGATLVTPNEKEITYEEIMKSRESIDSMLITLGERGMALHDSRGGIMIKSAAKEVIDVSGAGDTVVALMALGMASRLTVRESAHVACFAAGIVVGKRGTATVTKDELLTALHADEVNAKLVSVDVVVDKKQHDWKGLRIGIANGVFDMLHAGHLNLLSNARKECDKLIVAINSDASVKRLKGDGRPIHNQYDRAKLLAGLSVVDMVVIFDEDSPLELIDKLKPNIIFKGSDYKAEDVIGAGIAGEVKILPHTDGVSTTSIFEACKLYDTARKRR